MKEREQKIGGEVKRDKIQGIRISGEKKEKREKETRGRTQEEKGNEWKERNEKREVRVKINEGRGKGGGGKGRNGKENDKLEGRMKNRLKGEGVNGDPEGKERKGKR